MDATNGFVYEGEVPELLETNREVMKKPENLEPGGETHRHFNCLRRSVSLVSPLNLTDPGSASFSPSICVTLHDLARFVHEESYREMFMMGDNVGDLRGAGYKLDVFLPIDLYIIDLGGGLKETPRKRTLKRSQIASVPLSTLLTGMLHGRSLASVRGPWTRAAYFLS